MPMFIEVLRKKMIHDLYISIYQWIRNFVHFLVLVFGLPTFCIIDDIGQKPEIWRQNCQFLLYVYIKTDPQN